MQSLLFSILYNMLLASRKGRLWFNGVLAGTGRHGYGGVPNRSGLVLDARPGRIALRATVDRSVVVGVFSVRRYIKECYGVGLGRVGSAARASVDEDVTGYARGIPR
jgi:hypothetical protein